MLTDFLEDIKSGKTTLSPENAQLAATFLGISMEVQDKVNHNKVVEKKNATAILLRS